MNEHQRRRHTAQPAAGAAATGSSHDGSPARPMPLPQVVRRKTVQDAEAQRLPAQLKAGIEAQAGVDLDDVRVHYNSDRPTELQAHSYAHGSEIHLAPGQESALESEVLHLAEQRKQRPTAQR